MMSHVPANLRLVVWVLAALVAVAGASRCNGEAPPGPRNTNPIDEARPAFVRSVPNGKLFTVGHGDDAKDLIHVWGSPYANGLAMGTLLGPKLVTFMNEAYDYIEGSIVAKLNNKTWCGTHTVACKGLREVMRMTLTVVLYFVTVNVPFIQIYRTCSARFMTPGVPADFYHSVFAAHHAICLEGVGAPCICTAEGIHTKTHHAGGSRSILRAN